MKLFWISYFCFSFVIFGLMTSLGEDEGVSFFILVGFLPCTFVLGAATPLIKKVPWKLLLAFFCSVVSLWLGTSIVVLRILARHGYRPFDIDFLVF